MPRFLRIKPRAFGPKVPFDQETDNVHLTSWLTPFHPFYFPFSDVQMLSLCRDCASTVLSGTFHVVGLSCSHGSGHNNLLLPPPHKPPFNSKTQQQQILRYSSRVIWRADADARTVEGYCLFKWQDHNSKWKVCEALWRKQKHSLNNFEARFRFWCGIFMIWFPRNRARKSQIWANENLGAVIMTEGFLSSLWKRWEWERVDRSSVLTGSKKASSECSTAHHSLGRE